MTNEQTEPWEQWVGSTAAPTQRIKRGARVDTRRGRRWITYQDQINGADKSGHDGLHDSCPHRLGGPQEGGVTLKLSLPGFTWRCGCPCHRDPFRAGRLF